MKNKVAATRTNKIELLERRSACPISATLEVIGDKWSLLVIRDLLFASKKQFGEIASSAEGISTNVLADRLKRLENVGIVEKTTYQNNPPRYNYNLTRRGRELRPVLLGMIIWGNNHIEGTYSPTSADLDGKHPVRKNCLRT